MPTPMRPTYSELRAIHALADECRDLATMPLPGGGT